MSGHPRVPCIVEGCNRGTTRIEPARDWVWLDTGTKVAEWLCPIHWRRVPQSLKARRRAVIRLWRRRMRKARVLSFYELAPGSPQRVSLVRSEHLIRAIWRRCVRVASGDVDADDGELPPDLAEELRRAGL